MLQRLTVDLAVGKPRELVEHDQLAGRRVGRRMRGQVTADLLQRHLVVARYDEGDHALPPFVIVAPGDGSLGNVRVARDELRDPVTGDVLTAGDNHVVRPTENLQAA